MKDDEFSDVSNAALMAIGFTASAIFLTGYYYSKRYAQRLFGQNGGVFSNCSAEELKALKVAFDDYYKVSAEQHEDIKMIRQALGTLNEDLNVIKTSMTTMSSTRLFFNNSLNELTQSKAEKVKSLLCEYPVLTSDIKVVGEIEKIRLERESHHELVKIAFEGYLKEVYGVTHPYLSQLEQFSGVANCNRM